MKHPFHAFPLKCLILALCTALLASCHKDEPETPITRTILVYMAAQNSLGAGKFQRADSAEIANGHEYIPADGRVLMLIDDDRAPRLYEVTQRTGQPRLVRQWERDVCTTSPATLLEVLGYVKQTFASADYGLVMWSHADGWLPATDTTYTRYTGLLSFGIDSGPDGRLSNNGAQMNVEDMATAINDAGMHFRYIFFDACLMQNVEVAYALRHATDYVVAAPMSTPGAGSDYTADIRDGFFAANPSAIARAYLTTVQNPANANLYSDFGLSISCIRTDRMQALADALREALPYSTLTGRQSADMTGVLNYQAYTSSYLYRPHNYDARQALRAILPAEQFERVSAALDAAVVYHGSTASFWIGPGLWTMQTVPVETDDYRAVSIFIPQDVYSANASCTLHGDLNRSFRQTEWYTAAGWAATGW